jgi:solute:Na+ symporter, SSS family
MTSLDSLIVGSYILLIFMIAWKANGGRFKSGNTSEDQYLAGRDLSFIESICSIIATEVSALTFLGIPAFSFNQNFSFVQIYMGAIIGRLIIALVFLPKVYAKGLTIYEVMANNTGESGRRAVGIFYSFSKVFSVGVRLFSGSILVSQFIGINVYVGLAATTLITFLYTLIGGLKAVVRTDILQMSVFIFGGIAAHFLIPQIAEVSWGEMMSHAQEFNKTTIFDFSNPMSIIAGLLGGILFDMSTHGVDQDFVQRLTGNRTLKKAQLAIFLSAFISICVGLLFLGVGALLWSYYQSHIFPPEVPNADHLFAHFIVNYFPTGIKGLMVAGVLAATMSTLDSTINALCATVYNDILPQRKRRSMGFYFLIDNLMITFLLFIVAFVASKNDGLLMLGLKVQSWTAGALLGIFLIRVVFKKYFQFKFTATTVVGAYAFGLGAVALNTIVLDWNWNWNTYFGSGAAMVFLILWSKLKKKPKK